MEDGMDAGAAEFDGIDSNLTVFALANGLDLSKGDGYRRLEWFSEGLERCVVIDGDGADRFALRAMTWRTSRPEARTEERVADGLSSDEVRGALSDAIDRANELEAPTSDG